MNPETLTTDPTMTPDRMKAIVARETTNVRTAESTLKAGQDAFARIMGSHGYDGSDLQAAIEAGIEEQHGPARDAAEGEANRLATSARANMLAIIDQIDSMVPAVPLSGEDLVRAGALKGFIEDDIDRLTYRDLATALRTALATDDKASIWLYVKGLPERFATDQANGVTWTSASEADRQELQSLIREGRDRLQDRSFQCLKVEAQKVLSEAGRIERLATKRAQSNQTYVFTIPNAVKW